MIPSCLTQFFSCKQMIRSDQLLGDCPTSRTIYKETMNLAWPSALERILVSLVGAIDTMMVGVLGAGSIAAVGITQQPMFILLAIIFSLNTGVTAIVARRFGEQDYDNANRTLRQSIILVGLLSLLLSCIGFIYAKPILLWMGAEPHVIGDATVFFRIILIGMFFNALTLNMNAAQRGAGNTKIAMYTNITANLVNLVFNFLLIQGNFGFPMLGVKGAAIATVLGNIVAFTIALFSLIHSKNQLKLVRHQNWKLDFPILKGIFVISSSAMVEQLCMRIGFLAYTKMITNLGTIAFATHQICMNILNMTFSVGDGMSMAASSLVGRNLGAKRPDLSIIYGKTAQRIGLILSSILVIVFLFGRTPLVGLFTNESDIIALGSQIMLIVAIVSPLQISQVIISGSLRGAGDTKFVAGSSFISILVIRPIITFSLCYGLGMGLLGAWIALLLDQTLRLILNIIRFSNGKWTLIKI
ncbi:MAG: MATE family efflux transporter [Cellulosilyticaceae bacterium]